MKRFLLLALLFSSPAFSQTPSWEWARSAGDTLDDIPTAIVVDGSGNSYVAGRFCGGSVTFGNTTLYNPGNNYTASLSNVFLVKYDANGNVVWARGAGGYYADGATDLALDPNGYLYMCGYFFNQQIVFGNDTLLSNGQAVSDLFLVKYDLNGNELWAKSAGGFSDEGEVSSIATDAQGNCYVAGMTRSAYMNIGAFTLTNSDPSGTTGDIFVARYDPSGNVMWATRAGTSLEESATAIAADPSGNTFITGDYYGPTLTLGNATLSNPASGSPEVFAARLDANGNFSWAVSAGSFDDEHATGIARDLAGNLCITGTFSGSVMNIGSTTLVNAGYEDLYIAGLDPSGNVLWTTSGGSTGRDFSTGVTTDAFGNILLCGYYSSPSLTFGNSTLTNSSQFSEIFVVKYSSSGTPLWAQSASGLYADRANAIATDASSDIYAVGEMRSIGLAFGPCVVQNNSPTGKDEDLWIAKIGKSEGIASGAPVSTVNVVPTVSSCLFRFEGIPGTTVQVYDMQGRTVAAGSISSGETTIDLSGKAPGMYSFRALDPRGNVAAGKLILE